MVADAVFKYQCGAKSGELLEYIQHGPQHAALITELAQPTPMRGDDLLQCDGTYALYAKMSSVSISNIVSAVGGNNAGKQIPEILDAALMPIQKDCDGAARLAAENQAAEDAVRAAEAAAAAAEASGDADAVAAAEKAKAEAEAAAHEATVAAAAAKAKQEEMASVAAEKRAADEEAARLAAENQAAEDAVCAAEAACHLLQRCALQPLRPGFSVGFEWIRVPISFCDLSSSRDRWLCWLALLDC